MDVEPVLFKVLQKRLCVYVIRDLMATIVANSFVLVSLCVATGDTALFKVPRQPANVTMVLMVAHVNVVYLSSLDLNATNV